MLSMMLVARILGKEEYGQLGIIQSSLMMFEAIAALGMGTTTTKHIAEYRNTDKSKVSKIIKFTRITNLVTAVSFGVVIYLIAPWISSNLLGSAALTDYVRISSLILFFTNFGGGRLSILIGFEAYPWMAFVNGITGCMTVLFIPGSAYFYGIEGALWGLVAVSAANALMNSVLSIRVIRKEGIPKDAALTRDEWRLLWEFSLPTMMASILYAPVNWLGGAYLVRTSGYGQMGLFSAVNQWFSILLFVPLMVTKVFLPIFANQGFIGREREFSRLLGKALKTILLVSFFPAATVALLSPWIMSLYGKDYSEASTMLIVIAFAAFVASSQNMLGNVLTTINRTWLHFAANVVWAIVYLLAMIVLVEFGYNAMGLCLAMLIAFVIKLMFSGFMVRIYVFGHLFKETNVGKS